MSEALAELMKDVLKDELDAREAQGVKNLKEATIAIKNGEAPSKIKRKYGADVYNEACELMKSLL